MLRRLYFLTVVFSQLKPNRFSKPDSIRGSLFVVHVCVIELKYLGRLLIACIGLGGILILVICRRPL